MIVWDCQNVSSLPKSVCCPLPESSQCSHCPQTISITFKSQAVTNAAVFQEKNYDDCNKSQMPQLCTENLRQLWKKPGYRHTIAIVTCLWWTPNSCEIPWHSFSQNVKYFFKIIKVPMSDNGCCMRNWLVFISALAFETMSNIIALCIADLKSLLKEPVNIVNFPSELCISDSQLGICRWE